MSLSKKAEKSEIYPQLSKYIFGVTLTVKKHHDIRAINE